MLACLVDANHKLMSMKLLYAAIGRVDYECRVDVGCFVSGKHFTACHTCTATPDLIGSLLVPGIYYLSFALTVYTYHDYILS